MQKLSSGLMALFFAGACADDIAPAGGPDAAVVTDSDGALEPAAKVATERNDDGTYTTVVDATSMTDWTTFDLETGVEATLEGPWDLSAQRFHLKLNGGESGDGGARVVPLAGADFAAVSEIPEEGWISDAADGADEGDEPDYAFEQGDGWYAYDAATHVLTPLPIVWVVETTEGSVLKLVIESYYDDAGTPATFTLRWQPLGPPPSGVAP
jgi:hypothetical protein